jgi:short-subunit dehydrogenase
MPAWLWMTPDRVVAQSLNAMRAKRPTVVIPGRRYRWIVLVARYAPKWFIRLITGRYRRDR